MTAKIRIGVGLAARKAGSKYRLAKLVGVTPQAVQAWQERGQIPAAHVLTIERVLGIGRHLLRPDIYPPADYRMFHVEQKESPEPGA